MEASVTEGKEGRARGTYVGKILVLMSCQNSIVL